jgi:hypothetical protein
MSFARLAALCSILFLCGCATPSGQPAQRIAEPDIAAAFMPLLGHVHLVDRAAGVAMVFAPGIAVTNAHNANLVDARNVIGTATLSDLMFFHVQQATPPPPTALPVVGAAVTAYGEDVAGDLRIAHGRVVEITMTPGYATSPYFIFQGDAGPGFSGGPVVDASGKLIGITFGYKDGDHKRLIYAYDMARVRAEFSGLSNAKKSQ